MRGRSTGSIPSSPWRVFAWCGTETSRSVRIPCMTLVGTVRWTFLVLAVAATVTTLVLLLWSMRGRGREPSLARSDRRRPSGLRRDPREALALVGDALAATHNPRVLLPVILEVITEATDALGGQIFSGADEVAWLGEVGGTRKPLTLELDATTRL